MRIDGRDKDKINYAKGKIKRHNHSHSKGRLTVVGIGPGSLDLLTYRAKKAIQDSQVIIGYKTYINLLANLIEGKEIIASAMTREIERVKLALDKAKEGKRVCLISSGDPGIYGMAGPALELLDSTTEERVGIEVIPGVMAALSCASLLGAPLMNDFAVISLSDLLTDLAFITQRLEAAAKADFIIVLYNPKSKRRVKPLEKAYNILLKHRSPDTPVGIVRNSERKGQKKAIISLKDILTFKDIDMATTIIVGNSTTYVKNNKYMIAPRGYVLKVFLS